MLVNCKFNFNICIVGILLVLVHSYPTAACDTRAFASGRDMGLSKLAVTDYAESGYQRIVWLYVAVFTKGPFVSQP